MTSTPSRVDEFYIGYVPTAPPRTARTVRASVIAMIIIALAASAILAAAFRDPGDAVWSTEPVTIVGELIEQPYPMLRTRDGQAVTTILLVAPGKFGASALTAGRSGQSVRVTGTPLTRDGRKMLELAAAPEPAPRAPLEPMRRDSLGAVTLRGEIVDSKCFLGAMKPGDGKLHKACAILCISGGIPPVLAEQAGDGSVSYHVLLDAAGNPANRLVLPYVAESVEIRGELERWDDLSVLRISAPPGANAPAIRPL